MYLEFYQIILGNYQTKCKQTDFDKGKLYCRLQGFDRTESGLIVKDYTDGSEYNKNVWPSLPWPSAVSRHQRVKYLFLLYPRNTKGEDYRPTGHPASYRLTASVCFAPSVCVNLIRHPYEERENHLKTSRKKKRWLHNDALMVNGENEYCVQDVIASSWGIYFYISYYGVLLKR